MVKTFASKSLTPVQLILALAIAAVDRIVINQTLVRLCLGLAHQLLWLGSLALGAGCELRELRVTLDLDQILFATVIDSRILLESFLPGWLG
jgi:hypothetical protein